MPGIRSGQFVLAFVLVAIPVAALWCVRIRRTQEQWSAWRQEFAERRQEREERRQQRQEREKAPNRYRRWREEVLPKLLAGEPLDEFPY